MPAAGVFLWKSNAAEGKSAYGLHGAGGRDKIEKTNRREVFTVKIKSYEIYKHIGDLSRSNNGWTKELNLISWNNREPVYDIRTWNQEHTEYGEGVTITAGQMAVLKNLLNDMPIF